MRNLLQSKSTLRVVIAALLVLAAAGVAQATGSLATARALHTATALADGTVLVVGGQNNAGDLASAEVFDPTAGTFSSAGSMATARTVIRPRLWQTGPCWWSAATTTL